MIIIYRFRNKLFHGMKDIGRIDFQKDNIIHSNKFLISQLYAQSR